MAFPTDGNVLQLFAWVQSWCLQPELRRNTAGGFPTWLQVEGKKTTSPKATPDPSLGFVLPSFPSLPWPCCHTCSQVLTSPERISLDLVTSRHES